MFPVTINLLHTESIVSKRHIAGSKFWSDSFTPKNITHSGSWFGHVLSILKIFIMALSIRLLEISGYRVTASRDRERDPRFWNIRIWKFYFLEIKVLAICAVSNRGFLRGTIFCRYREISPFGSRDAIAQYHYYQISRVCVRQNNEFQETKAIPVSPGD